MELALWIVAMGKPISKKIKEGLEVRDQRGCWLVSKMCWASLGGKQVSGYGRDGGDSPDRFCPADAELPLS